MIRQNRHGIVLASHVSPSGDRTCQGAHKVIHGQKNMDHPPHQDPSLKPHTTEDRSQKSTFFGHRYEGWGSNYLIEGHE